MLLLRFPLLILFPNISMFQSILKCQILFKEKILSISTLIKEISNPNQPKNQMTVILVREDAPVVEDTIEMLVMLISISISNDKLIAVILISI